MLADRERRADGPRRLHPVLKPVIKLPMSGYEVRLNSGYSRFLRVPVPEKQGANRAPELAVSSPSSHCRAGMRRCGLATGQRLSASGHRVARAGTVHDLMRACPCWPRRRSFLIEQHAMPVFTGPQAPFYQFLAKTARNRVKRQLFALRWRSTGCLTSFSKEITTGFFMAIQRPVVSYLNPASGPDQHAA